MPSGMNTSVMQKPTAQMRYSSASHQPAVIIHTMRRICTFISAVIDATLRVQRAP